MPRHLLRIHSENETRARGCRIGSGRPLLITAMLPLLATLLPSAGLAQDDAAGPVEPAPAYYGTPYGGKVLQAGFSESAADVLRQASFMDGVGPIDDQGHAQLSPKKVFTEEERNELRKLFSEYIQAENEKKVNAEKEKKEKEAGEFYEIGSDNKLNAVWNNGLWFESAHKDWNIHFGGRLQFLATFWDQPSDMTSPAPGGGGVPNATDATRGLGSLQDGTFFRRVRLRSDGVGYDVVEYVMEINFEQLSLITFDHVWVGMKDIPLLGTVRVGQHKIPQGMEMMGSDYHLTFLERSSLSDAYWTLFGQGIFISNNYFDQHVSFQTMFHRIQPTGFFTSDFGTGDYAETTRLTWTPLYADEGRHLVHVGGSYQWRRADLGASIQPGGTGSLDADRERVVRFRARPELRDGTGVPLATFTGFGNTTRFVDSGFLLADKVHTLSPEFLWICGPFSLQAEGAWAFVEGARAAIKVPGSKAPPAGTSYGDPMFWGGYAQASYLLTGEHRGYDRRFGVFDRPKVRENAFWVKGEDNCCHHGLGAWEVAYRYSYLDVDDNNIHGGLLGQHTAGINWYFNDNFKMQFNYLHISRDVYDPAASGTVHGFGWMTQWYF